jgi:DNA polymerase I-like protein with 3'-5' exonuclease and polymerase domains
MAEDLLRFSREELQCPAKLPTVVKKTQVTSCPVGFDTEFGPDLAPITLGIALGDAALGVGVDFTDKVAPYLRGSILVGHNVAVDVESLSRLRVKTLDKDMEGWLQGNRVRDTSLLARLADENRGKGGYKLESLSTSLLNIRDWKKPTEDIGIDSTQWPKHLRDERCRLDAWATLQVYHVLKHQAEGPAHLSHKIAMTLRRIYWSGVYISKPNYLAFEKAVDEGRKKSLAELMTFVKKFGLTDFSPTKDDCLRAYVYGENGVGLQVDKLTKGGLPTVAVKALKEFKDRPAIATLIEFSKYDKLQSTYCESLRKKFVKLKDGYWIPVIINPLAAKTGRRSSTAPNFQNWPVPVRKIIISRWKKGLIADNDYSKLEPILGGWVTGEPSLTDYFVKNANGYIKIGEDFFKQTIDKNGSEYKAMKSLVLAILYNKKKWSLAEDLWVNYGVKLNHNYDEHIEEAGKLLEKFLKLFPRVKRYHEVTEHEVLTKGVIYNALGQARRLPLPLEPERSDRMAYKHYMRYKAHVINQAINYRIQSLASYVTGCAMIDLEAAFLREWKWSYGDYHRALMEKDWPRIPLICNEVHDDLVQDIPPGMEKKTKEITHAVMSRPPSLVEVLPELFDSNVVLSVDTNTGVSWGLKS